MGYANGGAVPPPNSQGVGIASGMMPPPPMDMPPPPMDMPPMPPPPTGGMPDENMMASSLAREYVGGIDQAETAEEMMNAVRTNNATMEQRVAELAAIVGEEDAKKTPESVLIILQPLLEQMSGTTQPAMPA